MPIFQFFSHSAICIDPTNEPVGGFHILPIEILVALPSLNVCPFYVNEIVAVTAALFVDQSEGGAVVGSVLFGKACLSFLRLQI